MIVQTTGRGFDLVTFRDRYGEICSLQKSSLATENCIWFGVNEPKVTALAKDVYGSGEVGWVTISIPEYAHLSGRMHLTQEQVRELLPYLIKFAETGELT